MMVMQNHMEAKKHNEKIDNMINILKKDKDVTNIRNNQKQVDIDGNVVGNNRPDIQFGKQGKHTNIEYDTRSSSLRRNKNIVQKMIQTQEINFIR